MDELGQIDPNHPGECRQVAVRDLIDKADAGTRLWYSLYHHPNATEVFRAATDSRGFVKAWAEASRVFCPDRPTVGSGA